MPKIKTDFAITPVSFYKFICSDENITSCYVGHTINFTKRKSNHKGHCNNEKSKKYHFKIYETIRTNGGWDNWSMIEISSQLCDSERHAERVEQQYISELKSDMNMRKAFVGDVDIKQYHKQHYENNKEYVAERNKQKIKCDCGCEISRNNLYRHVKSNKHKSLMCV